MSTYDSKNDHKPYDLSMIYAISENNPDFLGKLIAVFSATTATDNVLVKEAAANGDWAEVAQLVHKMKSSLNHFQVSSLKETIAILEHYENSSATELNSRVLEFNGVVNNVLVHLKAEFPDSFNK